MVRPRNDPIALIEFGKKFKALLDYHGVSQSELARQVDKLTKDIVNGITVGNSLRSTPLNFLRCLQGLVILEKLTEEDEVKDWLQDFYTARGEEYRDLEETPEGREILERIKQIQKRHQKVLEGPKYTTIQGIPLVGRDEAIREIYTMLQEETRFLNLVGPPGIGKSEIAWQIEELAKTQGYVTLSISLELVTSVADALCMIKDMLESIDTQAPTLVILDDCDKIARIKTASAEMYKFLKKQKHLTILATSCVRFSEDKYDVVPLTVPPFTHLSPDDLKKYDAVRLFLEIAKRSNKQFTLTEQNAQTLADICIALDGHPLGLHIAASRTDELGMEGLYTKLQNSNFQTVTHPFPDSIRHVSLKETITWSYDLLNEQEQKLFRRLGVFRAKFDLEAVASVCNLGDFNDMATVEEIILTLARYSLITVSNRQIRMTHNTIRTYALSILEKDKKEAAAINELYYRYILDLAYLWTVQFGGQPEAEPDEWKEIKRLSDKAVRTKETGPLPIIHSRKRKRNFFARFLARRARKRFLKSHFGKSSV